MWICGSLGPFRTTFDAHACDRCESNNFRALRRCRRLRRTKVSFFFDRSNTKQSKAKQSLGCSQTQNQQTQSKEKQNKAKHRNVEQHVEALRNATPRVRASFLGMTTDAVMPNQKGERATVRAWHSKRNRTTKEK